MSCVGDDFESVVGKVSVAAVMAYAMFKSFGGVNQKDRACDHFPDLDHVLVTEIRDHARMCAVVELPAVGAIFILIAAVNCQVSSALIAKVGVGILHAGEGR